MVTQTEHRHVVRAEGIVGGEPIIKGTRTPVRAIVETWRMGVEPEAIAEHMPHLTITQVTDALGYYHDHRSEIDDYIERN